MSQGAVERAGLGTYGSSANAGSSFWLEDGDCSVSIRVAYDLITMTKMMIVLLCS